MPKRNEVQDINIVQNFFASILCLFRKMGNLVLSCCGKRCGKNAVHSAARAPFSNYIEEYRKAPLNRNRWSLLLWRVSFPIFTLSMILAIIVVGQMGTRVYTLLVGSLWYYSSFFLQTYPFILVYEYQGVGKVEKRRLFQLFGVVSVLISLVELVFTSNSDHFAWLIGNTMYGMLSTIALPLYFYIQNRRTKVYIQHEVLEVPEMAEILVKSESTSNMSSLHDRGLQRTASLAQNVKQLDEKEEETSKWIEYSARNQSTKILYVAGIALIIVWLVSWATFLAPSNSKSKGKYLGYLYIVGPMLAYIFFCERNKEFRYNFEYLIFYGCIVVHVPDFLGHLALNFFVNAEAQADQRLPHWAPMIQLVASILFLGIMQAYLYLLLRVVKNVSQPNMHSSLMYIGQLYYYMFWYLLVGNDAPIDAVYWAMLALNVLHIVLANTGLYMDVWDCTLGFPFSCCSSLICYKTQNQGRRKSKDSATSSAISELLQNPKFDAPQEDLALEQRLRPLYFLMKMAEQDHMADTSALILVPSILTTLAALDAPAQGVHILTDKRNLWLRCIFMFVGRICSSYLAQEIFAYKLRKRLTLKSNNEHRTRIQTIMLVDFQKQFWFLTMVTLVCTFACFERLEWPARFAFLNTT